MGNIHENRGERIPVENTASVLVALPGNRSDKSHSVTAELVLIEH